MGKTKRNVEASTKEVMPIELQTRTIGQQKRHIPKGMKGLLQEAKRAKEAFQILRTLPIATALTRREESIFARFAKQAVETAQQVQNGDIDGDAAAVRFGTRRATDLGDSLIHHVASLMMGSPAWFDRQITNLKRKDDATVARFINEFMKRRNYLVNLLNEGGEITAVVQAYRSCYDYLREINQQVGVALEEQRLEAKRKREVGDAKELSELFSDLELEMDEEDMAATG